MSDRTGLYIQALTTSKLIASIYVKLTSDSSLQHESGTWHCVLSSHEYTGLLFQSVMLYRPQQLNYNIT